MNKVLEFFIKAKDLSSDVIQRIVGKIHQWRDEAQKAAKATADANKQNAQSMTAVNDAMKRTSVNWEAIKQQEEDAKKRKRELAALERELKAAMLEAKSANGEAAKAATERIEMLKKGIGQLSSQGVQDFNAMELGMNALSGNFAGMAKGVINLAAKFKILGMSMAMMSVYALAIMAIVKIFTWWRDSIEECNQKIREIKMDGVTTQLGLVEKGWKAVNERMEQSIKTAERATQKMNALADAEVSKQSAVNDQKREAELAGTDDADERERINRKYDAMNEALSRSNRDSKASRELDDERNKLKAIGDAIEQNKALLERAREVKKREMADRDEIWWDVQDKDDEDYKAANERVAKATEKVKELADKQKALWDEYNGTKNGIDVRKANMGATVEQDKAADAKRAREAADAEKAVSEAKKQEQEQLADELDGIWRDWYNAQSEYQKNKDSEVAKQKAQLLADYYDALAAAESEKERTEIRAEYARQERELQFVKQLEDERLAKQMETEQKRAEAEKANRKAQLAQDIEDAKARVAASTEAQSEAQARASAAKAAVAQAWGWYRNRDSMEAYRKEKDSDLEAQRQYEKDYQSLTHGRNANKLSEALYLSRRGKNDELEKQMAEWRKGSFGLSVEDEATMRVAIAKDEERRANQALQDISENTAYLKDILGELQGEGEVA